METKMKKALIASVLLLISSVPLLSQTVIGKYGGEFLAIGVGGRASGMGGAQTAIVNDVTAGYWNPAALAHIDYPQAALMHEEHFGSLVNYNYAAVAIPYDKEMSLGFSVIRLSIDGIPDTRNALYDSNGDGIIDIHTDRFDYSKITEFNNTDWAFFLTFAKRQTDNFYWGASVKIIRRDIAEYSATGIGFDIGAFYRPFNSLLLGLNFQDITTTLVAWDTGRNELITPTLKTGAAYLIDFWGGVLSPAIDIDTRFENRKFASNLNLGPVSFDFHTGIEYRYKNIAALRIGYSDVKQLTIGAGIKLPKMIIDYSYSRVSGNQEETLPESHRISLLLTLEDLQFKRKE
ncbi:Hypothetical protein MROS_0685 [Melioribacter roseus P3M-2]|jgi:hypothetical protein|uniref:PorV/PorQ family protein n=2 Tax=Melioribacteraceae TaxID=1334117 RepID=I6ZY42_MELRP|nr:Hypothetical protein MROS_0685 [Melioribacter roseus P3M-2]